MFFFFKKTQKKAHCSLSDSQKAQLNLEGIIAIDADLSSGYWVKKVHDNALGDYVFCLVSDSVTSILHGKRGFSCIGKSDHCVARDAGLQMSEEQFANVCRGSDNISVDVYNKTGKARNVYIEFIRGVLGDDDLHIWKTTKTIIEKNGGMYIYGWAEFLDVTQGSYQGAMDYVERHKNQLEKINNNLYVFS